jgi:hypothetical protein
MKDQPAYRPSVWYGGWIVIGLPIAYRLRSLHGDFTAVLSNGSDVTFLLAMKPQYSSQA